MLKASARGTNPLPLVTVPPTPPGFLVRDVSPLGPLIPDRRVPFQPFDQLNPEAINLLRLTSTIFTSICTCTSKPEVVVSITLAAGLSPASRVADSSADCCSSERNSPESLSLVPLPLTCTPEPLLAMPAGVTTTWNCEAGVLRPLLSQIETMAEPGFLAVRMTPEGGTTLMPTISSLAVAAR